MSAIKPTVPEHLQEECCKCYCVAKFTIQPDGKTHVKLVESCGCSELDDLALDTLRLWKFKPAMLNGQPVLSTRKIKIEFEVQ